MILYKKELTNKIAERTGFKKQDIKRMLIVFSEIIYEELLKGNSIILKNVFKFEPCITKAGERYNPYSKQWEYREGHRSLKMNPSKKLRQAIREGEL